MSVSTTSQSDYCSVCSSCLCDSLGDWTQVIAPGARICLILTREELFDATSLQRTEIRALSSVHRRQSILVRFHHCIKPSRSVHSLQNPMMLNWSDDCRGELSKPLARPRRAGNAPVICGGGQVMDKLSRIVCPLARQNQVRPSSPPSPCIRRLFE